MQAKGEIMSDKELGQKMVEEEELLFFLEAYENIVEEALVYGFGRYERPDFICHRPDSSPLGVELVKVMRDPRDALAEYIIDKQEFMDGEEALKLLYHMVEKKEKKRCQPDWNLPDDTILVLQFVDCPISYLHLDGDLKADFSSYGFSEIWIADYTDLEAYRDIELFCLYPED